ncbi:TraB/GumN family protein, partial [Brevundimonas sp.]|uniref:TraB/GumN family protein n=1 Tax=Brevundimonas sp. TaxID=1871086 RepID=UPI002AB8FBAD
AVDHMQPWTAALMVQMLPMFQGGFDVQAGADVTLSQEAHRADQRVRYFETIEQQLRFFADLPMATQIQLLEDSLGGQMGEEDMKAMQAGWVDGDVQLFGPMLIVAMRDETPELYDALIRRRNKAWVEVLQREMAGKGISMVNVGALHMVGEDGLVTQLRARGFVVERVQ